jgi:Zn-finger nucleic acid-binding protein
MECPVCSHEMTRVEVDGIGVDTCKGGCGGVWFDAFEFEKFDEAHEEAGACLLEIETADAVANGSDARSCPKCDAVVLAKHFYSVQNQVEINECPSCAGVWLDAGELNKIRNLYGSEEEKIAAFNNVFNDMFGDDLKKLKDAGDQDLKKSRRVANMLKYICPSNYLSGDQSWGAF